MNINAWQGFGLLLFFVISYCFAFILGTWYMEGQTVNYYLRDGTTISVLQEGRSAITYENICRSLGNYPTAFVGCDGSYATCGGIR